MLEKDHLVLRASKNPHADVVDCVGLTLGEGITEWVAAHNEPVAISAKAYDDRRFTKLGNLPENRFEAFLSVTLIVPRKARGRHQRTASRATRVHPSRDKTETYSLDHRVFNWPTTRTSRVARALGPSSVSVST